MSNITALGVHTYFGGFQHGVTQVPGIDVLGSVESWGVGIRGRRVAKVPNTFTFDKHPEQADLVFANPPCSRFSTTATGHFDEKQKNDIGSFDELEQVLDVAEYVEASTIWWETGPLCWRAGRGMIQSVHAKLSERWGGATTVVVKVDPRYHGVPQRRPRTHVIHMAGRRTPPPVVPEATWPIPLNIRQWIDSRIDQKGILLKPDRVFGNPVKTVQTIRLIASYMASTPRLVHDDDPYALTVLTGRPFAWADSDEWWSIEEYAALMTYPLEWPRAVAKAVNVREALMLLSKGVCPEVAAFVAKNVVLKCMNGEETAVPHERYTSWAPDIWEVEMSVPDGPKLRERLDRVPL